MNFETVFSFRRFFELNIPAWASVEERSRIRANLLGSKSERIRERIQKEYDAMNKIVKKNARRDKRAFADQLA